jgi:vanadium chloroperoxidase
MDQVLFWNDVALEANRVSFTDPTKAEQGGPTLSSRALAIVHLAMHDAYKGVVPSATFSKYMNTALPVAPAGASADAAIAGAAYTALVALYPKQKSFFDTKLNSITRILSGADSGHRYGRDIAAMILALRADDPDNSDAGYVPPTGRGFHKPDPSNPQGFLAPFYGAKSKLVSATTRHTLAPPPFIASQIGNTITYAGEYLLAERQVRVKGIATEQAGALPTPTPGSVARRTIDETLQGIFWAYDGANGIGTPPRLYNQIVRQVATAQNNTLAQNVRLFALVNVAMADAGILAWDQKYIHNFWRPVVGIREHDISMGITGVGNNNLDDDCDPFWLPLGAPRTNAVKNDAVEDKNFTPDFPAYPSGHATFGAAALHITRRFYGITAANRANDNLFANNDFVSEELNGVNKDSDGNIRPAHLRSFPGGLWQMILENGFSRVYLGVHWSLDAFRLSAGVPQLDQNIGGVDLGLKIANDIFDTGMQESTVPPSM